MQWQGLAFGSNFGILVLNNIWSAILTHDISPVIGEIHFYHSKFKRCLYLSTCRSLFAFSISGLQIELNKRNAINFSYDTVQNARKAEHVLSITETLFFCKIYDVNS